jgi:hypothetical protein
MTDSEQYPPPPPPPPPPGEPTRKGRRRWPWIVGVAVVLVIVAAVAISDDEDDPQRRTVADATTTTAAEPSAEPPAVEEPTTTTAPPDEGPAVIGPDEWFTWTGGVEAQVTALERYTPDYDDTPGVPEVAALVTVRNGTSSTLDLTLADARLYGGPNGVQAERDYAHFGFEGSAPAGGTVTARYGFSVPEEHMSQIVIEFAPSWEHDSAFFEGAA